MFQNFLLFIYVVNKNAAQSSQEIGTCILLYPVIFTSPRSPSLSLSIPDLFYISTWSVSCFLSSILCLPLCLYFESIIKRNHVVFILLYLIYFIEHYHFMVYKKFHKWPKFILYDYHSIVYIYYILFTTSSVEEHKGYFQDLTTVSYAL